MRANNKFNSKGFTIVELMIATSVFSVILLICTMALIQIGRVYYKGVLSAKTQNTTRAVIEEITSSIKFSGGDIAVLDADPNLDEPGVLCLGNTRYTYFVQKKLEESGNFVLVTDKPSSCDASSAGGAFTGTCSPPDCRELLSPGMRLSKFEINLPSLGSSLYTVTIGVISGDTDLLEDDPDPLIYHKRCKASLSAGGQFCAASELTTYAQKRI